MATGEPTRAGSAIEGNAEPPTLFIGQERWTLGRPVSPVVRALALGFALGVVVMTLVALLNQ